MKEHLFLEVTMSLLLKVPFEEKEEVKVLGAKWDEDLKLWHLDEKDADKVTKKEWFIYCPQHETQKAVDICESCGNFICDECKRIKKLSKKFFYRQSCYDVVIQQCVLLAIGVALFFASFFLMETSFIQNIYKYHSIFDRTIISILFAGTPFGWNFLGKYTSRSNVSFSAISWCFYFVLKLILSWVIGIFTLIINIVKIIKKAIQELINEKKITLYHLIFD